MPMFTCDKCGCEENTALGYYWPAVVNKEPRLCSECHTGTWHGKFPKAVKPETADAEAIKIAHVGPVGERKKLQSALLHVAAAATLYQLDSLPSEPMPGMSRSERKLHDANIHIAREYRLIQEKKSKLSRSMRDLVVHVYENE